MTSTSILQGAKIDVVTADQADASLNWLLSDASFPVDILPNVCWQELRWAVLQATDALVWGVFEDDAWRWATEQADPDSTAPCRDTLLEVRVFGPEAELLIWRTEDAFAGRILGEDEAPAGLAPLERRARFLPVPDPSGRLIGSIRRTHDPAFVRRESGDGRTTVTPTGMGIHLRHYVEQDVETGVLRIAATRFVAVLSD